MSSQNFKFGQKASVNMDRSRGLENSFAIGGKFHVEHFRDGQKIGDYRCTNGVADEGINHLLDGYFDLAGVVTAWYMGLVDNANYTSLAAGDTYDDIDQAGNGWDEFKTYTDNANASSTVTRPVWGPDAASAKSISNSSQIIFDITGSATVKGLFIVGSESGSTAVPANKGDHASDGILWATALFDQGDTAVVNGDQLKITYTISAS